MSDTAWTIHGGDVYCPFCGDQSVALDFTFEDHFWFCDRCRRQWNWDHDGTDWIWPDGVDKPSPGCPYCGTQNIRGGVMYDGKHANWLCMRDQCRGRWAGFWTLYDFRASGGIRYTRWTIRIPRQDVPFRRTLDNPTTYPHQETS